MRDDQAIDQKTIRRTNVTLQDVAARAGTSASVASAVLNRSKSKSIRVGKQTEKAVLEAAASMGYRRNPIAQGLATGRTRAIGLILGTSENQEGPDPFFSVIISGVSKAAARFGYGVLLFPAADEDESLFAARHLDRRIDGVIVTAPKPGSQILRECRSQGLPFCAISPFKGEGGISVSLDDYQAGVLAVRHLISLGHKRIAHLYGRPEMSTTEARKQGWSDALAEADLNCEDLLAPGSFCRETGRESMAKLLQLPSAQRPSAVFASNDLSAHGALDAIQAAGLSCPSDVAVVGCDNTWYATITKPELTTIHGSAFQMGEAAASSLIGLLEGDDGIPLEAAFAPHLVIRESCGGRGPSLR